MPSDDLVPRLGARADRKKNRGRLKLPAGLFVWIPSALAVFMIRDRIADLLCRYQGCLRRSCTRAALPGREASYSMAPQLHKTSSPCSHFCQHENGLAGFALFCFVTCLNVVTLCFFTARISSDTKTVSHLFIKNSSSVGRTESFQRSPCWFYLGNRPFLRGAGMDTGGKYEFKTNSGCFRNCM